MPGPAHWARYGTETAHALCGNPTCGQKWPCPTSLGLVLVDAGIVRDVIRVSVDLIRQSDAGLRGSAVQIAGQRYGYASVRADTIDALTMVTEALGTATFGAREAAAT